MLAVNGRWKGESREGGAVVPAQFCSVEPRWSFGPRVG